MEQSKTKIIFISNYSPHPKYKDGASIRVFSILESLIDSQISYLYVTFENNKCSAIDNNYNVKYLKKTNKSKFNIDKLWNKSNQKIFDSLYKEFTPTHIICEGMYTSSYCLKYKQKTCIQVVDTMSYVALKKMQCEKFLNPYSYILFVYRIIYEKYFLSKFINLATVAEIDAKVLSSITKKKVKCIPNGVDTDINFINNTKDKKSLLFLANYQGYMNSEAAEYVLKHVATDLFNKCSYKIVIAGKNVTNRLRNYANKIQSAEIVEDVQDLNNFYNNYKIFLCAVEYGTGIKNSVLNAMATNQLIICNEKIAKTHKLTDGVNCLIYNNRSDISELISKNKNLIEQNSIDNSKLIKNNFSWKKHILDTINLYDI